MKKIFMLFLLCFTVLSSSAFADGDIFVKIKAIKIALQTDAAQYIVKQRFMDVLVENMIAEDNIAPMVTLDDVTVACLKTVSVEDKKSVCHNFLLAVADAHNADLDSYDPSGELKQDLGIDKSSIEMEYDF